MSMREPCSWQRSAAVIGLLVLGACSAPQPRPDLNPVVVEPVISLPTTRPEVTKPPPLNVSKPAPPWQRLRERFAFLDCENNPAVLREARRYTSNPHRFSENWRKALPLFLLVLEQIERRDLPGEFALLPYVESHYRQLPAKGHGPAGMWQLMERTAVDQGLKVNRSLDERLDARASTAVAIGLLERYDRQFSDWRVANLAFNAGEYRVKRALGNRQARQLDREQLASLRLSKTSHEHLARLMALSCIINDPQRFSVSLPSVEELIALESLELPSPIDLRLAAVLAGLPLEELLRFNAAWAGPEKPFGPASQLSLPPRSVKPFELAMALIPDDMLSNWHTRRINSSTTLESLASRLDISPLLLARANGLDPELPLKIGQELLLPGPAPNSTNTTSAQTHTIRRGDTLSTIARRYGVQLSELLRWNTLTTKSILKPGVSLRVRSPSD